jgi:hypothetical protein
MGARGCQGGDEKKGDNQEKAFPQEVTSGQEPFSFGLIFFPAGPIHFISSLAEGFFIQSAIHLFKGTEPT